MTSYVNRAWSQWIGRWVADCHWCRARFGSHSKEGAIKFRHDHIQRRHMGLYGGDSSAIGKRVPETRELEYHPYPEDGR